jgi:3-oxoacyl-(acyl-carrier-protein) synthase
MGPRRRVVVTGLGQVSALGLDVPSFSRAVFAGIPGVVRLEGLACPGLADPIGAAVAGFDAEAWMPARLLSTTSRSAQFALAAARQALAGAGLEQAPSPATGVYVGSGFGGIAETEETYRSCFSRAGVRPKPSVIPLAMANAPAGLVASELRLRGPNLTLSVACSSATHAIGQAFRLIREGGAEAMLAGGTDAPLTPIVLAAWNVMRVLAPAAADPAGACRPFSRARQGIVVGEGAAFLVLESLESAHARGATALAEVLGYGANADAGHVTHPDPRGIEACMALALEDAELRPSAVSHVNAHGTGTQVNDRLEAEAIAALFAEHAPRVAVSSTKAVHGHAMGASGALEAVAAVLAILEGRLPPTANLDAPDPALPALDYVAASGRRAAVEVALSNSFAFGGNNAVLALGRIR